MESRIMQVFYDNDCLPFKDIGRSVHYPIVGSTFNGANNTTQIRFFVDRIGGTDNVSWVVIAKLPNGKIQYQLLSSENIGLYDNEHYISFDLSSYYTQYKGDVYISLNGYQGDVQVEEDEDTGIYTIVGTPMIQATGSIKLSINYAPQMPQGNTFGFSDYQLIAGALSGKANVGNTIYVLNNIASADLSGYAENQLFYDKTTQKYYIKTENGYELEQKGLLNSAYVDNAINTLTSYVITQDNNLKIYVDEKYIDLSTEITGLGDLFAYIVDFIPVGSTLFTYSSTISNHTITMRGNVDDNTLELAFSFIFYTKDESDDKFVPYSGATNDVDLGEHTLKVKKIEIDDQYHTIDLVGDDMFIGTGIGKVVLSPDDGAYYDGYEIANKHDIANAISNVYKYKGAKTVAEINSLGTSAENGDVYNVTNSGTLTQGSVSVIAGDNVAWDSSNSRWDKLAGSVDLSGYVPYTGATNDINIGNHTFNAQELFVTSNNFKLHIYQDENNIDSLWITTGVGSIILNPDEKAYYGNYEIATKNDLTSYVPNTQTIAGIDLSANISAQALTDSLVFMNNTTDLDYVMED